MSTRRFAAVFFDLGNTLIHFVGDWSATAVRAQKKLAAALTAHGFTVNEAQFAAEFGKTLQEYNLARRTDMREPGTIKILEHCLRKHRITGVTKEQKQKLLKVYYSVSEAQWLLPRETHLALDRLRREGYRMALISNAADSANVRRQISKACLGDYLEQVLISHDLDMRKPQAGIFHRALELMGIPDDQAVMVGDTLAADILGARNAGIRSIWLTRWANTAENHFQRKAIQPDASIFSLLQLPRTLSAWNK